MKNILSTLLVLFIVISSSDLWAQITFSPPFTTVTSQQLGGGISPIADFNGDGKLDIAYSGFSGYNGSTGLSSNIVVYYGNGSGNFSFHDSISLGLNNSIPSNGIISADYNLDGKTDLAAYVRYSLNDSIIILLGSGSGVFLRGKSFSLGTNSSNIPHTILNADITGDGKMDLVVHRYAEYKITLFINDSTGGFLNSTNTNLGFGINFSDITSVDINGDTKGDLVASEPTNNSIWILRGSASGAFSINKINNVKNSKLTCNDFNNDGKIDIATFNSFYAFGGGTPPSLISIFLADSLGNFSLQSTIPFGLYLNGLNDFRSSDLNNDGNIDLIYVLNDTASVLVGQGNATFVKSVTQYRIANTFSISDINGDGKKDLAYLGLNIFEVLLNTTDNLKIEYNPKSGGNGGDVTINFLGFPILPGMKLKLVATGLPDIVVPDSMITFPKTFEMKAIINLRQKSIGDYNVILTATNGVQHIKPNGFKIVPFKKPDMWVQIMGSNFVRNGRSNIYNIQVGNNGNCDVVGIPLLLYVSDNAKINFSGVLTNFDGTHSSDSVHYEVFDSLFADGTKGKIYWLLLSRIQSNSIQNLQLEITPFGIDQMLKIKAIVNNPLFASPLGPDQTECLGQIFKTTVEILLIPFGNVAGCIYGATNLFVGRMNMIQNNIQFDARSFHDFGYNLASTALNCVSAFVPAAAAAKAIYKIAEKVNNINDVYNTGVNGVDLADKCGDFFNPNGTSVSKYARIVNSYDPNDKIGIGSGYKHYVTGKEPLQYAIRFENLATATADAQIVKIVDTLDNNKLDLSTFQLNFFSFSGRYINIWSGQKKRTEFIDLRPQKNLILQITAELNETTGVLNTQFISLDPNTLQPTTDPLLGFLPPNVNAPEGEGSVSFSVSLKTALPNQALINNKALIYFDNNQPIVTPVWINSLDKITPISKVNDLPNFKPDSTFTISWSGSDNESGIERYNIFYAVNGGAYQQLFLKNNSLSYNFTGKPDSTYSFYSIAIDSAGNIEQKSSFDAKTTITTAPSDGINVYPNPSNGKFVIQAKSGVKILGLSLYDLQGKRIAIKYTSTNDNFQISINNFVPFAMYILKIQTTDKVIGKKILLSR